MTDCTTLFVDNYGDRWDGGGVEVGKCEGPEVYHAVAREDFGSDSGFYLNMNAGEVVTITETIEDEDGVNWAMGYIENDPHHAIGRFPISNVYEPWEADGYELHSSSRGAAVGKYQDSGAAVAEYHHSHPSWRSQRYEMSPYETSGSPAADFGSSSLAVDRGNILAAGAAYVAYKGMTGLVSGFSRAVREERIRSRRIMMHPSVVSVCEVVNPKQCGRPDNWVADAAKIIQQQQRMEINRVCERLFSRYGVETAIVTLDDVRGHTVDDLRDFFTDLFNLWGLGDPRLNNGLLVGMVVQKRRVEIITGSGMDRAVPGGWLKRIQEMDMIPAFKYGNFGGGLLQGINLIEGRIDAQDGRHVDAFAYGDGHRSDQGPFSGLVYGGGTDIRERRMSHSEFRQFNLGRGVSTQGVFESSYESYGEVSSTRRHGGQSMRYDARDYCDEDYDIYGDRSDRYSTFRSTHDGRRRPQSRYIEDDYEPGHYYG